MSLKSNIYKEICSKVFDPLYAENTWRILVLDEYSTQIVSNILKMHDLFDKGITLVDDLNKRREPVPLEAIYLFSPKLNKIQLMLNDFVSSPTYRCAHVFFTDECSMDNLSIIGESIAANYILTLKEININFIVNESQLFHFDFWMDNSTFDSFNDLNEDKSWEMARALTSLCEILNENPSIYYQNSEISHRFAIKVQQELSKTLKENDSIGQSIHKDRSILLILDRSIDPITPALHDLHLQCLAYDVLQINNNSYSFKNQENEKITRVDLTEEDALWIQLRHMHIADVSRILPIKLKQLASAQKSLDQTIIPIDTTDKDRNLPNEKTSNKDNVTKQLLIMMKKMPHLRQEVNSVNNMFYLSEACLSAFQAGVKELCECEQSLVTGTCGNGEPVKFPEKMVINVINNTVATMSEKIRLLLILILSQSGILEDNLIDLVQKLRIDDQCNDIFHGIQQLGDFIHYNTSKSSSKPYSFQIKNRKKSSDSSSYILSRWVPFIRDIITDAIAGHFDPQLISKLEQPRLTSNYLQTDQIPQRQSWAKITELDNHIGPRLIVFIVGGVSYAESRIIYDITKLCTTMRNGPFSDPNNKTATVSVENGGGRGWSWEVLIGGTSILTPEKYLSFLSKTK